MQRAGKAGERKPMLGNSLKPMETPIGQDSPKKRTLESTWQSGLLINFGVTKHIMSAVGMPK